MATGDDAEVFIALLPDNLEGGAVKNQHGALAGEDRETLERRDNRMGSQETNRMNSLLLHSRKETRSLWKDIGMDTRAREEYAQISK
mmetsp:Transcript_3022/g.2913  ORF Transcript_3022/g.2913 Transcript_3022/m.2913 type:complete len:87 (-) Transcript_3022:48-308(-)